ncbi:MAG TPA: hypothetical protein VJ696_04995, partial [Rhodanobacteraceae bacterium]|nr:hypothetical protein [Rhodanobacteraceae bacterium]
RPVDVLRFNLGEHYADALVQSVAARDELDRYEAVPGREMAEGQPQKAGGVDCKKKVAFAELDLSAGVRVLTQARAIAAANGYKTPENVELAADVFCNDFGWRAILLSEANPDAMLELAYAPNGASPRARQMRGDGWAKVDMKALLAGTEKVAPAAPKAAAKTIAGDGRKHDFFAGINGDLKRIEAAVGAPLAFKHIRIDGTQLSVDVLDKKRIATWLVDGDGGGIRLWHEDDTIPFDCNKGFSARELPLDRLPAMIAGAPALIPPMARGWVKSVGIYRSGLCGAPHVYIEIEDERGYGNVEYDARGKLISAEVQ